MQNAERPSTSSAAITRQSSQDTAATATPRSTASTPLAQIGKQSSLTLRHSQLYDSGAESGDADEHARLIRTPSSRSHKFIIIPATPPPPPTAAAAVAAATTTPPTFTRQISSASSLSALVGALQKTPTTAQRQSATPTHSPQQQPQLLAKTATAIASVADLSATKTAPPAARISSSSSYPAVMAATHQPQSQSDVIHQPHTATIATTRATVPTTTTVTTTEMPATANPSGVTFTIEDCESDSAAAAVDGYALDAIHPALRAISSIKSASQLTPTYTTATTTTISSANSNNNKSSSHLNIHSSTGALTPLSSSAITLISSLAPNSSATALGALRSTLTASETTPTFRTGLRPRSERSSMRSVVSAYVPSSSHDPLTDAALHSLHQQQLLQQQQHHHYFQPSSGSGKDLSASSSYIYRDIVGNQIYSDVTSVRSLASIGIGSTDGRRLVIRRVPNTPHELFSLVNPPSPPPPGVDDNDDDSFLDVSDELKPRQQHWANKMQFVLACIGYSVGLGNVWRFPYMCYKSGGGVFLVPYCIILFICSIPLLFMELSVGQYTGRGPIGALGQLCPLFKGAGLASVVVSFLMSTYYSVIIAYSIYYFFTSFKPEMPWIDCSNRWNSPDCWVPQRVDVNLTAPAMSRTPSEEFFENKVLQISHGIEYPGAMRWELFACLICAWLMVYFATWKSIKSSAKVRYFTATFPFILIIILMGRAVTLEGADAGLRYFFRPNWSELKNANVWINAASQNFNSLGITFGSMISFASYNKYNNNIVRDTVAVSAVNILTSLLVGVFAFATLGNLALEQNTNVRDVISDGPGLIFVVYPQAMAKMPYAQLWAVMFFFMLLCLGLNSQFAIVEVVVTSIQDGFPNWIRRHLGYHEIVVLFVCVISFLFGLPNLIQGGIYFFQLMDHYAASISIMFLAFCQMVAVAWFYGTGRLSKNVKQMTGKAPSLYLKSCWILLGPCLLFAIWVLSLVNYEEPSYHNGRYKYPDWAYGIGWMFASFSLVCIPGYAVINFLRAEGRTFWERLKNSLRPNIYECRICGEHHCEHDFPEQEQYMLAQELTGIYKPNDPMDPTMQLGMGLKSGYNPMHLQQQKQTEFTYEQQHQHQHQLQLQQQQHTESTTQANTATTAGSSAT